MFFRKKAKSSEHDGPSLSSDIAATRKAGIKTAILVTFLVSGIVPALSMMFNPASEGLPFVQQMKQMWTIALVTYPLTIVVATLTILRKRKILTFGNLFLTTSIIIFCASVGNTIGVFGGHEVATPMADNHAYFGDQNQTVQFASFSNQYQLSLASQRRPIEAPKRPQGLLGLPAASLEFFTSYLTLYGWRTFLASVLVGMFAGSTANRFLEYVSANRRETIGLAKQIYDARGDLIPKNGS